MESIAKQVKNRIVKWGKGKIFFHSDFADFSDNESVRKAITRLCDEGFIKRYGRGIFYYPKTDKYFGLGQIEASNIEIAQAYAKSKGLRLYQTELASQNLLGLTTQNQINTIYLTNGSSKKINTGIGNGITFIHTSDSNLTQYKSDIMLLINIALDGYANHVLQEKDKIILSGNLSNVKPEHFNNDIKLMKIWKRAIIYSCRN
jgi:hypothetical protein